MRNFHYVYILVDVATDTHHHVGFTQDLSARLAKHNAGDVPHTSRFRPRCIETAVAFDSKEKAAAFERYLKSGSGREFAKRHF
ncbi:MAG: GIY-YIG nuclease family protein [Lentisphaeria bacterium]|nr:GIY-YIG nuclease family protein [Lentisphaeria bacterium]